MCARKAPNSPRATRKFNTDLSESSSCGSDTSERLSPYVNIRNVSINVYEAPVLRKHYKVLQWQVIFNKTVTATTNISNDSFTIILISSVNLRFFFYLQFSFLKVNNSTFSQNIKLYTIIRLRDFLSFLLF